MQDAPRNRPPSRQEKIAIVSSVAILLAATTYWVIQILDVITTLRLAYGRH